MAEEDWDEERLAKAMGYSGKKSVRNVLAGTFGTDFNRLRKLAVSLGMRDGLRGLLRHPGALKRRDEVLETARAILDRGDSNSEKLRSYISWVAEEAKREDGGPPRAARL